jgi:hypothetical protein
MIDIDVEPWVQCLNLRRGGAYDWLRPPARTSTPVPLEPKASPPSLVANATDSPPNCPRLSEADCPTVHRACRPNPVVTHLWGIAEARVAHRCLTVPHGWPTAPCRLSHPASTTATALKSCHQWSTHVHNHIHTCATYSYNLVGPHMFWTGLHTLVSD